MASGENENGFREQRIEKEGEFSAPLSPTWERGWG